MTGREWAALAHRRLCRVAELAGEYGVLAEQTGNGDLAALVFQLRAVLRNEAPVEDDSGGCGVGEVSVDKDVAASWVALPSGGVRFLPYTAG